VLNVMIAGDENVVQRRLVPLLQAGLGDLLIREAKNKQEVLSGLEDGKCDVIVLNVPTTGPEMVDIVKEIRRHNLNTPVLVLTGVPPSRRQPLSRAGRLAVRTVAEAVTNGTEASDALVPARSRNYGIGAPHHGLSAREFQVFCLIAQGRAIKEIAFELLVSAKTVATYLTRIKEKTGLENRVDIARYALQNGLVI
jgi:two-component system invasion response regulator UvrY